MGQHIVYDLNWVLAHLAQEEARIRPFKGAPNKNDVYG